MRRLVLAVARALVVSSSLLWTRASGAQPANIVVAVDCPGFDPEARAALEARASAELLVRHATGTLVVACRGPSAELSFHPLTGRPAASMAPLGPDTRTSIDHILEALDALLEQAPALAPGAPSPENPPAPAPAAPATGAARPPVFRPPFVERRDAARAAPVTRTLPVLLGAGVMGELWSGTTALGPRVSIALPLPLRFSAGISGSAAWTLHAPQGVGGRLVRIALDGDYAFDRPGRFRAGAGAFVELLHASATGEGSDDKTVFGAILRATAAIVTEPVRVALGPTLAIHPGRIVVSLGNSEAFHLTSFVVGLGLDVSVGPEP